MKIVSLSADNLMRLKAVEITPQGNIVTIAGKNGQGKSSVLNAIWIGLAGKAVAPPKVIRAGEERALIKLDLGELVISRTFTAKEGGTYTDTVKVENAAGLRYSKPQAVLDELLGQIGFDPFAFVQMKPDKQAATLLEMVPLTIDLDEYAEADRSDYAKRRDINRDVLRYEQQLKGMPEEAVPEEIPSRPAIIEALGAAADTNIAIDREEDRRARRAQEAENCLTFAANADRRAADLRRQIEELKAEADKADQAANEQRELWTSIKNEIKALPPIDERVDTDALREQLREADALHALVERQANRKAIADELAKVTAEAERLTALMEARKLERSAALSKAEMPIDGLGIAVDEDGKPTVLFGGVPFEQASTAEQLRASTAIAMAANPTLRVLRIKDGSLLDEDSMQLLSDMAAAEDFQLWIERVGTGDGVGFVLVDGEVQAAAAKDAKVNAAIDADEAEVKKAAKAKPKGKAVDDKPEGAML